MRIQSLEVTQLRNLLSLQLQPHPSVNFVIGPNGSGKTSLLEAITLLSRGRSFRTPHIKKLISHGYADVTVFAEISNDAVLDRMGIRRTAEGDTLARVNGNRCERLSDLAFLLPTVEIEASSFDLLEGGPGVRRELLDWGLFHVEHGFLDVWKRYRVALEQKSALLRKADIAQITGSIAHWNQQLAVLGEQLHAQRLRYVNQLQQAVATVSRRYFVTGEIGLTYRPGWSLPNWGSLGDCLEKNQALEIDQRRALYGPHRAELEISWNSQMARDICSRGQKKLVIYAVRLAQVMLLEDTKHLAPVLLLDDLPAELDKSNIERISHFLSDYPCQSFITAIDKDVLDSGLLASFGQHRMFHVEHGQLIQPS